jgi:hypothetical protein
VHRQEFSYFDRALPALFWKCVSVCACARQEHGHGTFCFIRRNVTVTKNLISRILIFLWSECR